MHVVGTKGFGEVDSLVYRRHEIAFCPKHRGQIDVTNADPDELLERAGGRIHVVDRLVEKELISLLESILRSFPKLLDVVDVGYFTQGFKERGGYFRLRSRVNWLLGRVVITRTRSQQGADHQNGGGYKPE